jgi:hypothetical protein
VLPKYAITNLRSNSFLSEQAPESTLLLELFTSGGLLGALEKVHVNGCHSAEIPEAAKVNAV